MIKVLTIVDFFLANLQKFEWVWCRKGDPFQGLRVGSCLTLGNELFRETLVLTKQEHLSEKGRGPESKRAGGPGRTALHVPQSQVSHLTPPNPLTRVRCRVTSGQSF